MTDSTRIMPQTYPVNPKYFKEELSCESLSIPCHKPDMQRILDVMAEAEVVSYKIIDNPLESSNENQNLSVAKLAVELKIKGRIRYMANEPPQSCHTTYFELMKSMFVILPAQINDKDLCWLVNANSFFITPYVEDILYRMMDCRTLQVCSMLFVDVKVC